MILVTVSCSTATDKAINADNKFDTLSLLNDSTTFYFKTKNNWQDTIQNALDTFVNSVCFKRTNSEKL